jgi:hypothetical protein
MQRFSFLLGARVQQQSMDTATFVVGHGSEAVSISFFGNLSFGRAGDPVRFSDNGLFAAGLLDLAAQKIKVIQVRAEAKDYEDIHRLLSVGISLEDALGAAKALYPEFNPAISLKALSFFGDVARLPQDIQRDLQTAASQVRAISRFSKQDPSLLPDPVSIAGHLHLGERTEPGRGIEPELGT